MVRVVKRYGSRKLYDTEESRYVLLEEIGEWVRAGQEIRVVDTTSDEDVTTQILMQVILELGRRGSMFTSDILHDLIRHGERVVHGGVEQLQERMGRLLDASLDRIGPLRRVRAEADQLRDRLTRLEQAIAEIEARPAPPPLGRRAARPTRPHVSAKARRVPVRDGRRS